MQRLQVVKAGDQVLKRLICVMLTACMLLLPLPGQLEGEATIRLARTLYLLGRGEDYATLLDLGTVVMNRVDSPWYPDNVLDVLSQPHQFPCGTRYDERSLKAAQAVIAGRRTLPGDAVNYQALDASELVQTGRIIKITGNYEIRSSN